jgi:PadR family transcriptional regulator PadR
MGRAVSLTTLRVLRALLDDPAGAHYGLALTESSGVKAGALYPILTRLEEQGWITGTWEAIDERAEGRRRRRYYRLTAVGQRAARELLHETIAQLTPRARRARHTPPPPVLAPDAKPAT